MTEEEKAEMEAAAGEEAEATPSATTTGATPATAGETTAAAGAKPAATPAAATAVPGTDLAHHSSFNSLPSGATTPDGTHEKPSTVGAAGKETAAAKKGKAKLTLEQKAKLAELEEAKDKERAKRFVTSFANISDTTVSTCLPRSLFKEFGHSSTPSTLFVPHENAS